VADGPKPHSFPEEPKKYRSSASIPHRFNSPSKSPAPPFFPVPEELFWGGNPKSKGSGLVGSPTNQGTCLPPDGPNDRVWESVGFTPRRKAFINRRRPIPCAIRPADSIGGSRSPPTENVGWNPSRSRQWVCALHGFVPSREPRSQLQDIAEEPGGPRSSAQRLGRNSRWAGLGSHDLPSTHERTGSTQKKRPPLLHPSNGSRPFGGLIERPYGVSQASSGVSIRCQPVQTAPSARRRLSSLLPSLASGNHVGQTYPGFQTSPFGSPQ